MSVEPVFLTGSTGYIGGRLAPRLLAAGHPVRCLARSPRKLEDREWSRWPRCTVVGGDIADTDALAEQMRGCDTAYYLVHSMIATEDYAKRDRELARSFSAAAKRAGVRRIIYLGGLGDNSDKLSKHLRSRREVEAELQSAGVPVTVLRAAIILGSGSASFEILRYLVERLPIMTTPKWVRTECQPIAIRDVLHWLIAALNTPATTGKTLEIGGPDRVTYRQLIDLMSQEIGVGKRLVIPVPVLSPTLSARWIGLVTPVSANIARHLSDGLRNRVVVTDDTAQRLMPHETLRVHDAIRYALGKHQAHEVETRWSSAGPIPGDPDWAGGSSFADRRTVDVDATAEQVFKAVCRVGGGHGWYGADILWRIRGWMDQLIGGPGLRRGRRDPANITYGEALDFWRVTGIQRPSLLKLHAEMKVPGKAELDFRIEEIDEHRSRLTMTANFIPKGLLGLAYWYAVLPFHHFVFSGMLRGIRRAAEAAADSAPPSREASPSL